ncbi:MAG: peroxiredoxin [Parachlamydiaceae bacterium]|nr:peroxiredoxin [Parachlamydiaceae bacterium]
MGNQLKIGDKIPDFTSKDQEGNRILASDLLGSSLVIYFYPMDDTPGCTTEACAFRDYQRSLQDLDCRVVGISPDGLQSHQKFVEKHNLNFTLLSDEQLEVCKKFDVLNAKEDRSGAKPQIERTTFIVDAKGIIRWIEKPVVVEGHVNRVIEALAAHAFS